MRFSDFDSFHTSEGMTARQNSRPMRRRYGYSDFIKSKRNGMNQGRIQPVRLGWAISVIIGSQGS